MTGLVGYQGNSGQTGLSGVICQANAMPHDSSLVTVVEEKVRKRRDINVVCPFAGKSFSFPAWKKAFRKLPLERSHVLIYDNGNDKRFSARLARVCAGLDSYTLVRDTNPHLTADLSFDFDAIGARCRSVYGEIYNSLIDKKRPLSLNLEDDVSIPDGSFERLDSLINSDRDIATVIGQCNCRRAIQVANLLQTIAVDFKVSQHLGRAAQNGVLDIEQIPLEAKAFGTDLIGGGHMGLWLTRTDAIESVGGMGQKFGQLRGNDLNWGFAVNAAGLKFAIDWSVKLDHLYEKNGQVLSC